MVGVVSSVIYTVGLVNIGFRALKMLEIPDARKIRVCVSIVGIGDNYTFDRIISEICPVRVSDLRRSGLAGKITGGSVCRIVYYRIA